MIVSAGLTKDGTIIIRKYRDASQAPKPEPEQPIEDYFPAQCSRRVRNADTDWSDARERRPDQSRRRLRKNERDSPRFQSAD